MLTRDVKINNQGKYTLVLVRDSVPYFGATYCLKASLNFNVKYNKAGKDVM